MQDLPELDTPLKILRCRAEESPGATFMLTPAGSVCYAEFIDAVERRAGYFRACGVKAGSRVAIYSATDIEFQSTLFALWTIGAVCIPVNIAQKPEMIEIIESVVQPDVGFFAADITLAKSKDNRCFELLPLDGLPQLRAQLPLTRELPDSEADAIIMFTSGTSGVPKAVPMTHKAIASNAFMTAKRLQLDSRDRILINSPPYYTSSIIHILTFLSVGGSVAAYQGMVLGNQLVGLLTEFECTGFGGVPVHLSRLAGLKQECTVPPKVRFLMNSGEHLPVPVIHKLMEYLPHVQIFCVYGLTEVAGRLCILDADDLTDKVGSVGRPLTGMEITIRAEDYSPLPPGEVGQVYVTGPLLMKGYLNSDVTRVDMTDEYGFATGDFGRLDEDGCLFLAGRNDDIVKVGGEKVSINMIEEAAFGYEGVQSYAVAAVFDEKMGNVPCLFYTPGEGAKFRTKEIKAYLRRTLPSSHMPVYYREVDEIPRASSGKVLRKQLARLYLDRG